jgi:lactonase
MFIQKMFGLRDKGVQGIGLLAALAIGMSLTSWASAEDSQEANQAEGAEQGRGTDPNARTITATRFAKVSERHEDSPLGINYQSLLEGPTFGPDGDLYLTDVAAPAGEPKVLKLDLETKEVTPLHSDENSIYSSAQFSPADEKLYLTDFTGRIERMEPDGSVSTVFEGPVEGRTMVVDDIAFDAEGNMYITDFTGTPWEATGRLVRLNADGKEPVVLQEGLARPNGISFTPDYSRLWISETTAGRVSSFALSEDGTALIPDDAFIHFHVNNGLVPAREGVIAEALDSNAVDADGNLYQAVHGGGEILVWSQSGELLATVTLDDADVTNLAIEPGTRNAYATTAGEDGGYVYRFKALAEGIGQSNGGGL